MKKTAFIAIAVVLALSTIINFTACGSPTLPATPTITPTSTVMVFQGAADNRISNGSNSSINTGTCTNLIAGYASGASFRTLLNFDISALPVTATVTSAVLTINCTNAPGSLDLTAYKITKFWTEGTGCPGTTGTYSSWDFADGSANPWTTVGGDYNLSSASTIAVLSTAGAYNLTLNTAMVQAWVTNSAQNYGIILKAANELSAYAQITDQSGGASAPKLTVYYY